MGKITFLDGSVEEQTSALKEFFGLSSEQSFQDLEVEDEDEDNDTGE